MAEVKLNSIRKEFGDEVAIDSIDLTVKEGETLGVVGPSGCGKTTTLRTIAGFETPTEGTVTFDGADVTNVPPEDRNVGLVFQSYALFNNMSVLANIAFGLKMQGVPSNERRERAMDLLEMVGIEELADRDPQTLSGGQQQRVGLARALAIKPEILLLDEPMTGLDAKLKERLRKELGSLLDELEVTTLYVTHDQKEAMVMCDRIAVMNDGRLEQVGTPQEIYEEPANEFVAGFVGTANLLDATMENGRLSFGFLDVDASNLPVTRGDVTVIVRPDDIDVGRGPVEVEIVDIYYQGESIQATGKLPDGQELTLQLDRSMSGMRTGETLSIGIDAESVHVIDSTR